MVRPACCKQEGLKKGPWTPEEDHKLTAYVQEHGHGNWRALPEKAGLQRCGKSCRLRWINYLRPDIKRGKFSLQEEQTIIQLHALLGNRWSAIAAHLPKRTDNEIKNHWNTHLKKRLIKMGIDPTTHKPQSDALIIPTGNPKNAANLSHMAQWESARLEAEARLVRESKALPSPTHPQPQTQTQLGSTCPQLMINRVAPPQPPARPKCLDVLKAWQGVVAGMFAFATQDLGSPTSTLNFPATGLGTNTTNDMELAAGSALCGAESNFFKETSESNWKCLERPNQMQELKDISTYPTESGAWFENSFRAEESEDDNINVPIANIMEGLSEALVCQDPAEKSNGSCNSNMVENKNYWDSILNLVNSPMSAGSPVF